MSDIPDTPAATDTTTELAGHAELERFKSLVYAALSDANPRVSADIIIAAIDYAHARAIAAIEAVAGKREAAR
jgi:hypothetical protein